MAGNVQPIVFELLFDGKEAHAPTLTGYVAQGDPFLIRCVTNDEYDEVYMTKDSENEEKKKEHGKKKFTYSEDKGLYSCSAEHLPTNTHHERKIRISTRVELKGSPCSESDRQLCKGNCAIVDSKAICYCPPGTVGIHCDENLITDYVYTKNVIMVGGPSAVFLVAVCVVASILALLFVKEKRKTHKFVSLYGPLPEVNAYGEAFEPVNPYKKISSTHSLPDRTDAIRFPKSRPRPDILPIDEDHRSKLPLVDPSKMDHIPSIS